MTAPNELALDIEELGETAIVRCGGRLSVTSADRLRQEVKRLLLTTRVVTIDFTDVTMIDSMGLGTVAALYASARNAGQDLQQRLRHRPDPIRRIFGQVDGRHQPDRNGDEHGDQRDEQGAGEQRDRTEAAGRPDLVRADRRLRAPGQSEEKLGKRDLAEETNCFEQHRENDADRRQYRDARGRHQ